MTFSTIHCGYEPFETWTEQQTPTNTRIFISGKFCKSLLRDISSRFSDVCKTELPIIDMLVPRITICQNADLSTSLLIDIVSIPNNGKTQTCNSGVDPGSLDSRPFVNRKKYLFIGEPCDCVTFAK